MAWDGRHEIDSNEYVIEYIELRDSPSQEARNMSRVQVAKAI